MARSTKGLTDTAIRGFKPKTGEYLKGDGDGLSIKVKPCGKKSWIFNYYRPFTKKRTNIGFGTYPDVSLAQARRKRDAARELVAKDIDPKEHKDEQTKAKALANNNTLEHITTQWFEIKKSEITPSYAKDIWRSFERHIFPKLGPCPVHKLTAPKVVEVIKPIAGKEKGNLEMVKRLCQRLNEVMVWAVNTGLIEHNGLSGISKFFKSPLKRHMPTIRPEELPELMRTISQASIKVTTRCLIEWQLHTMTRAGEAAGTRWDEIDIDKGLWTIPPERMKKRRKHIIPLTLQTLALLEYMRPHSEGLAYVFPSNNDSRRHANPSTVNVALKRMGYGGRLVAHGLRSLASTTLNEHGHNPDVIEAALAHVDKNEVRRAYNRAEYIERRKVVMCWWSDFITQAAKGSVSLAGVERGNVIDISSKLMG